MIKIIWPVAMLVIQTAQAQTVDWSGNTNVSGTGILGSIDSDVINISFRTSSSVDGEPMRIIGSNGAISFGSSNSLSGLRSLAGGFTNTVSADNSSAFGMFNNIGSTSIAGFAAGRNNSVSGDFAVAMGVNNIASNEGSIALGDECQSNGHDAIAGGEICVADGWASVSFGYNLHSSSDYSITLGKGVSSGGSPLLNNIANSMMVAFDSNVPTLFVGGAAGSGTYGNVGVSTSTPAARFHVDRVSNETSGTIVSSLITTSGGLGTSVINEGQRIELSTALGSNTQANRGLHAITTGTNKNYAVYGEALSNDETGDNRGVFGAASGNGGQSLQNYGVYGSGLNGIRAYGVYGVASGGSNGNVGVYGSASGNNSWAGYFNGSGYLLASSWTYGSDILLKTNIQEIQGATEIIQQLKPCTYDYNQAEFVQLNLPSGNHFGFIAQEIEVVIPSLINTIEIPSQVDSENNVVSEAFSIKGVRLTELLPIAIGAIQEQQVLIISQQEEIGIMYESIQSLQEQLNTAIENIDVLSGVISECCAIDMQLRGMNGNDIDIVYPSKSLNELHQNSPNPFITGTNIAYSLEHWCHAKIVVYNHLGEVVTVLVDGFNESGMHQVEWNSSQLNSGIYYYALVIDGFEQVRRAVKL